MLTKKFHLVGIASSLLILVFAFDPGILYKLYSLVLALVAAFIGVALGLLIVVKSIGHAVRVYVDESKTSVYQGKYDSQFSLGNQISGKINSDVVTNSENSYPRKISFIERIGRKIQSFAQSLLVSISKSPHVNSQMQNPCQPTSNSKVINALQPLGRVPDRALKGGNFVCVSQNTDAAMLQLFEYTYRDYVEMWYAKVSCDRGRLHQLVKVDFWETFQLLSERLQRVDVVNLIMNRYIKTLLSHYRELDATDPTRRVQDTPASFVLHPCLRDRNSEIEFLRRVCDYIILLCFPEPIKANSSSRLILRAILSELAFLPMVDTLCDPDYINLSIMMTIQHRENLEKEKTRSYMYAATYEEFIKIINESSDITELQQIRYRIMTEVMHATTISSLKKDHKKAGKARSMAKGELLMTRNLKRYLNQCQVAKQQCEKRIRRLGENLGNKRMEEEDEQVFLSQIQLLPFSDLMLSPMARSYFLKYLKKIGKGSLLKYWNEVDIIRSTRPNGKDMAKLVTHVYQTYILPGNTDELPLEIDRATLQGMQSCVVGNKSQSDFYKIQEQVYRVLEKDYYPSFVVSDFYIVQLVPQIRDEQDKDEVQYFGNGEGNENFTAAFGNRKSSSDGALMKLQAIEQKLEYKAQALESLKSAAKRDAKVTKLLEQEIAELQRNKLEQQLHIERTEAWWSRMGKWNASIDKVQLMSPEGENSKMPVYTIIILCSGVPFYEATDDVSGWVVARNLTDFQQLHQRLKEFRPWLKNRRLPNLPMLRIRGLSNKFLLNSKDVLNEYLKDILQDEILRCSEIVYAFLSQSPDQMFPLPSSKLSRTGEENMAQTGGRKKSLWQIGGLLMNLPKDIIDYVRHNEDDDDISDTEDIDAEESLSDRDSIAAPMYELIGEIFEMQGLFRHLRKTLIIFVRLVFGGTINKQIRDTLNWLISDSMVSYYLQTFTDSMWPNGKLREKAQKRSDEEKQQTALEVQAKLIQNIPEALSSLVGHENARRGVLKIFKSLQDKRLNKHLFYNLLTETMEEVFPEIVRCNSE